MENKNFLHEHFEKLYFHEVEAREKINSRLQLPLAIITAMLGVIGYIIQNFQFDNISDYDFPFVVLFSVSIAFLTLSIICFIKTWYNNIYIFMPTPLTSLEYKIELESTYSEFENKDELVEKYMGEYLYNAYAKYASQNAECNDYRSENLNKSHEYIIYTAIALLISYVLFFASSLDKKASPLIDPTTILAATPRRVNDAQKNPTKPKRFHRPRKPESCTCRCACKESATSSAPTTSTPSASNP